jgi:hypothetical protein
MCALIASSVRHLWMVLTLLHCLPMKCYLCLQVQALTHLLQAPTAVLAAAACWEATAQAFTAIGELMKIFLAADASACPAELLDGSWDAGGVHSVTYAVHASCSTLLFAVLIPACQTCEHRCQCCIVNSRSY